MAPALRWIGKLKYPTLFKITAALFVLTLFLPDPLPFVDEILLAMGAMLVSRWKKPTTASIRKPVVHALKRTSVFERRAIAAGRRQTQVRMAEARGLTPRPGR